MTTPNDTKYVDILVRAIRVCARYRPKLGHGTKEGYSLKDFQGIYGRDPFYTWMALITR